MLSNAAIIRNRLSSVGLEINNSKCELLIYYVYMVSFALSRYHIWITRGLVLNVIC